MKILNRIFYLFAYLLLMSCGGGEGGSLDQGGDVIISGKTAYQKVSGGLVTVFDGSGSEIARTHTLEDGSYSIQVPTGRIRSGYEVSVTGGQVTDSEFRGSMRSLFPASHPTAEANITAVTTLVAKVAESTGSSNSAINKLTSIGMIEDSDWYKPDQAKVEEEFLKVVLVNFSSVEEWADAVADDVLDDDLRAENMVGVFPKAHGGILSFEVPGSEKGYIEFLKGYGKKIDLIATANDANSKIVFELKSLVSGIDVQGNSILSISESYVQENKEIKLIAKTGEGKREVIVRLSGIPAITLLEEVTSGGEELFQDESGSIKIHVHAPNSIPAGTKLLVVGGINSNSNWLTKSLSVPDVDTSSVEIFIPSSDGLNEYYGQSYSERRSTKSFSTKDVKESGEDCSGVSAPYLYLKSYAKYSGSYRVSSDYRSFKHEYSDEPSSALCSSEPKTTDVEARIPIIFIHGYTQGGGFGGAEEKTWGDFHSYAKEWRFKGNKSVVYNFRWRTNSRFQDVANDLKHAIDSVSGKTKRNVHIIAHSFGGVLARTYLQGLAADVRREYKTPVSSLTTIGSPHAGRLDEFGYHGIFGNVIAKYGCAQVSCLQVGDGRKSGHVNYAHYNEITDKIAQRDFNSNNLPIQVLIGIRDFHAANSSSNGDGLISERGQRFKPITRYDQFSQNLNINNALVTEKYLNQNGGYSHTSLQTLLGRYTPEVEVHERRHPSVLASREWIYDNLDSPPPKFQTIRVTLLDEGGEPVNEYKIEVSGKHVYSKKVGDGIKEFSIVHDNTDEYLLKFIPTRTALNLKTLGPIRIKLPTHTTETPSIKGPFVLQTRNKVTGGLTINGVTFYKAGFPPNDKTQVVITGTALTVNTNVRIIKGIHDQDVYEADRPTLGDDRALLTFIQGSVLNSDEWIACAKNPGFKEVCTTSKHGLQPEKVINISSISQNQIKAATFPQSIVINGSGFEEGMFVYGNSGINTHRFRSSEFIDSGKIEFSIVTGLESDTWELWVEGNGKTSNHVILSIDRSNKITVPASPKILMPGSIDISNPQIVRDNVELKWSKSNGAEFYRVYINDQTLGGEQAENYKVIDPQVSVDATGSLVDGHIYSWTVRSFNSAGSSQSSKRLYFQFGNSVQDCNPGSSEEQSCPITNGVGKKTRDCSSEGVWGNFSSCSIKQCNPGFKQKGNACVHGRPESLAPGSENAPYPEFDNTNITLTWSQVGDANSYELIIFDLNTKREIFKQYVKDTKYDASSVLLYGHDYYWSVRACDVEKVCGSRERVYLTIEGQVIALEKPDGLTPGTTSRDNPEQVKGSTQTLSWNRVRGVEWYQLDVTKGKLGSSGIIILNNQKTTNLSYAVSGLEPGARYRWEVQACTQDGCTESDSFGFEIEPEPLPAPIVTQTIPTPDQVVIFWSEVPGADEYELELVDANGSDDRTKTVESSSGGFTDLAPEHGYEIRVRAGKDGQFGNYSSFYEFTTKRDVPDAPDFVLVKVDGLTAFIGWQAVDGADRYRLKIEDRDGNDDRTETTDEHPIAVNGLTPGHRYRLKVQARKNGNYGEYSDYEYFKIEDQKAPCPLRHFTNNQITDYLERGFSDLQPGVSQVAELQNFLNELEHNAGEVDGEFGPGTEQAVIRYQNSKGLDPDGKVGPQTRNAINSTSCN